MRTALADYLGQERGLAVSPDEVLVTRGSQRRDFLASEIERGLGDDVVFDLPAGGLTIWLHLRAGLDAETWSANAQRAGLSIAPGLRFALDAATAPQAFRIGYANLDESDLKRVVAILTRTRPGR